jgi:hypothetical protein
MISILVLPGVNSPEMLKGFASRLLQIYQAKKGLLRAHAIPPTQQDLAQYLLTAIATGNGGAECVFHRILLLHHLG